MVRIKCSSNYNLRFPSGDAVKCFDAQLVPRLYSRPSCVACFNMNTQSVQELPFLKSR
jgi:hypothetical protein